MCDLPSRADELSWKAISELFGCDASCVRFTIFINDFGCSSPSMTNRPVKNQCRECSEFDCDKSKHSTVVGFRLILSLNKVV